MLRFVLRSETKLSLIQREFAGLLEKLPQLEVVSVNIQPQHAAILEGEKEIFLTDQHTLSESFNGIPLFIRPQSFFQTNPLVAQGLYATPKIGLKICRLLNSGISFVALEGLGCIVPKLYRININKKWN